MTSVREHRIYRQLIILQKDIMSDWAIDSYNECDLTEVTCFLYGPCDTPYENGKFKLRIRFPSGYPSKPLDIRFQTPIFHPNVSLDGTISFRYLEKSSYYYPSLTLCDLLNKLRSLICHPDDNSFVNRDAGFLLNYDREEFRRIAVR